MRRLVQFLAIAVAVVVSACGSSGNPPPGQADMTLAEAGETRVVVEIRNNLIPAATITAHFSSPGGRQRLLGTVRSNETQTFVIETANIAGGFFLHAHRPQQSELTSRRITEVARALIHWNLATNIIRVERP